MAGIFGEFFLVSSFPRNKALKILEKFGEISEQNSGQNSGQNFEKFGELSFCNFSDFNKQKYEQTGVSENPFCRPLCKAPILQESVFL